jgi:hypothetical protein
LLQGVLVDPYGFGECANVFREFKELTSAGDPPAHRLWLGSVVDNPVAYAKHRLAHYNYNTRMLLPFATRDVAFLESVPNPHGSRSSRTG